MLSAIVLVEAARVRDANACLRNVAKTLGALVTYVVADLVSDAFIVARPGVDFSPVETNAGCLAIEDGSLARALSSAVNMARRERLLLLRPGYAPDLGFSDEIVSGVETEPAEPRSIRSDPQTLLQRLAPGLAPVAGLVTPRASFPQVLDDRQVTLHRLANSVRARRLRTRAIRL